MAYYPIPNNNCGGDTLTGSCCFIKDNIPTCKDGITCSLCNSEYDGCWSENSCEDRTMNEELLCCHDCKKRSECKLNHPNKQKFSTYLKSRNGIKRFRSRVDGDVITPDIGKPIVDIDIPDPGVHTCCDQDCLQCLLDAMRNTESSSQCSEGVPIVNKCDGPGCTKRDGTKDCAACGCVPPFTQAKKENCWSCGPYQIQKDYWDDAKQQCHPVRAPECCELNNTDWSSLCDGTMSCAEQKRLSELAIMCYLRRYTRNQQCRLPDGTLSEKGCSGNCFEPNCGENSDCPDRCFTCEDLARIHNGGGCGHLNSGTEEYINDPNKVCHWLCEAGGSCPACLGCDCGDGIGEERAIKEDI